MKSDNDRVLFALWPLIELAMRGFEVILLEMWFENMTECLYAFVNQCEKREEDRW